MASIEKRSDNTYRITVSCGYDSKGKKLRKYKTITLPETMTERQKEKEVQKQAALFEREVENGTYMDGEKITFAEFADKWLVDYAEKQLAPKTVYEYKKLLNSRVIPALGHIKINKLQPTHIIQFYNNLSENGMRLDNRYKLNSQYMDLLKSERTNIKSVNPSTINNLLRGKVTTAEIAEKLSGQFKIDISKMFIIEQSSKTLSTNAISHYHSVISTILTAAVQWQLIDSNPCIRVKPPKVERKEAGHYDEKQVSDMFILLEKEDIRLKLAVYVGVFAGVRLGELSALEWGDIDYNASTIRINKNRQYIPSVGSFDKSTKTYSGNRVITVPGILLEVLEQYRKWQIEERLKCGDLWNDSDKIFTQWDGKEIFPSTPSKWFTEFIKRANLDKITFHQLRHPYGMLTLKINMGLY